MLTAEKRTIKWLEDNDELKQGKTTLKKILLDLEELVLGNAGVDSFEEIFKLIYAKLYDEWRGINDSNYQLQFFVGDRNPEQVKNAISELLEGAKREWPGVFEITDKIELRDTHLKICVSFLEKIKLFNSNLRIIDEAFEYLIPEVSKKKGGQFFTPRPVQNMIVSMLNPKPHEFVIDPACGSAGFLLHSVMHIAGGIFSGKPLPEDAKNFAQTKIYGIDFSKKAVKIAKAINLIVGDGKSHIFKDNSLAPHTWDEQTKAGLRERLLRFPNDPQKDKENQKKFLYFDFDILMTNPPFAGTVKERDILRLYRLAEKNGRLVNKIDRHILFVERCLQFLKPGGRMAIVLPQGLLNNTSAEYIRRFIIEEARILAVVGLHVNTFKPHTGIKTSVLFLRKYTDEEKIKIQGIKLKYENQWERFLNKLINEYENIKWDDTVDKDTLPEELLSFLETFFEIREEEDLEDTESKEVSEEDNKEDSKSRKSLSQLKETLDEYKIILEEKKDELSKITTKERKQELKKEIKILEDTINKLISEISQRTIAGQISLVLNNKRILESFKKHWLEGKIMKELDYPIFFAVNEKPVKDESGEYRFDHDLDEIAEAFINFAKDQLAKGDNHFDFWR